MRYYHSIYHPMMDDGRQHFSKIPNQLSYYINIYFTTAKLSLVERASKPDREAVLTVMKRIELN